MGSWAGDSNTKQMENSYKMFRRKIKSLQSAVNEFLGFTGLSPCTIENRSVSLYILGVNCPRRSILLLYPDKSFPTSHVKY